MIENVGHIPHHGAYRGDIQVAKICLGVDRKVVIADIAPAHDGKAVIGNDDLVMHAVVYTVKVGHKVEGNTPAMRKRIEDSDLDIGVGIYCRNSLVAGALAHVIHQQTYPDAAVGGAHQAFSENTPRFVRLPDIDLQIKRFFSPINHSQASCERSAPIADNLESRFTGVLVL